jgi:tRNA guanosine-2'-O-methyltransferase
MQYINHETKNRFIVLHVQVKPHLLSMYLEAKKKDGYTLIGAEQTSNSTRLNDFKFPQKTLLLLG